MRGPAHRDACEVCAQPYEPVASAMRARREPEDRGPGRESVRRAHVLYPLHVYIEAQLADVRAAFLASALF